MSDLAIVLFAILISYLFRVTIYEGASLSEFWRRLNWLIPAGVLVHLVSFYIFELYSIKSQSHNVHLLLRILLSVAFATGCIALLSYVFPTHKIGRVIIMTHVIVLVNMIYLWRKIFIRLTKSKYYDNNLMFIDIKPNSSKVVDEFQKFSVTGYNLIGMVSYAGENPGHFVLNGDRYPNLYTIIKEKLIDTVVFSENPKLYPMLNNQLIDLKFNGVEIFDFPTFYQIIYQKLPVMNIKGSYFLFSNQDKTFQPYVYLEIKRVFDFILALLGLVLSFPLLVFAAFAIKSTSKGSIFFKQERLGQNEQPFRLIKLRTMIDDAEKDCGPKWSYRDDPRITKVGKFLRKTHIDEIPQLINIIRGEMSFVGPRPIRKHFAGMLAKDFPYYRLRFSVKPGLTGWAQVKGNYAGSIDGQLEKFEYELFYIQNRSIFFDLFVILKTIQTVIFRSGV